MVATVHPIVPARKSPAPVPNPLSEDVALLRRMLDAVPEALLVFDARWRIVLANGVSGRTFGWRPQEMALLNLDSVIAYSERGSATEFLAEYFAAPYTVSVERGLKWRMQRRHGAEFTATVGLTPARVAGRLLAIAVIRPGD